jgi:hypothetical protein
LTAVDSFTRWVELFPVKSASANDTIQSLIQLFCRFGVPLQLMSDCGPHFTASIVKKINELLGIGHMSTPPYHPASNGLVE